MSEPEVLPLDRKALSELLEVDPELVNKVADEVAEMMQDPIVANSLAVCLFCRRLSMIALSAVDRQLKIGTSNPDIALRIVRETSRALRETGKFTVKDLEAEAIELVPPYFEGLAAATMFQQKVEENEHANVGDVVADLRAVLDSRAQRFSASSGLGKPGTRKRKSGRRG